MAEFIHILVLRAVEVGRETGRTIITDEDLLGSIESLGITQYSKFLKLFMSDYPEAVYNAYLKQQEERGAS